MPNPKPITKTKYLHILVWYPTKLCFRCVEQAGKEYCVGLGISIYYFLTDTIPFHLRVQTY